MKAVCWYGSGDIRVESVPDPQIINPHDAIVRVTLTAICGSDLHIYNGFIPGMARKQRPLLNRPSAPPHFQNHRLPVDAFNHGLDFVPFANAVKE